MAREECLREHASIFKNDIFHDHVALVVGGGSGICFRIAELFLRHGATVIIASRSEPRLRAAVEELRRGTRSERCDYVVMDVRDDDSVRGAVETVVGRHQRIQILINGAAGNFLCAAGALTAKGYRTVMDIDAVGTFAVSRAVYSSSMRERGGVIINVTATLHYAGTPMQVHAGSAKAAIEAASRHLAVEWGSDGVRVLCVAPGPIENTEGFDRLGGFLPSEALAEYKQRIPAQRFGTRSDIANACLFLASDAGAGYVTGTTLVVDGGAWMTTSHLTPAELVRSRL